MRTYLREVISAQSSRRQEKIQALLEEARVGKEQLEILFERLKTAVSGTSPLQLEEETTGSRITSGPTTNNLRQIGLRIAEMYRLSNVISLLLNSHASILSAEVKGIEEELNAMESMVSNYAFMLADAKAYDYAYLEPFNNYINLDEEFASQAPDRSISGFDSDKLGHINKAEGTLVLPRTRAIAYNIYPRVVGANFTVDTSRLDATTSGDATEGWRTEFISSSPIVSSLPGTSAEEGAQVILEYETPEPKAASHVKLSPFSDVPIYVESVKVFLSEESQPTELLNEPVLLDRAKEFSFPLDTVAKFQIHLNQRTFTRTFDIQSHADSFDALNRLTRSLRIRSIREIEQRRLKDSNKKRLAPFAGRDFQETLKGLNVAEKNKDSNLAEVFWDALESSGKLSSSNKIVTDSLWMVKRTLSPFLTGEDNDLQIKIPKKRPPMSRDGYRYALGLKSVVLGVTDTSFKGVFVSTALDADGDIGEIRLKVGDKQYVSPDVTLDNRDLTSVEYSVSNAPSPLSEGDWEPILPVGSTDVTSERLFPNEFGLARLRFEADRHQTFKVYKNGIEFSDYTLLFNPNQTVTGVNIMINQISSDDIFTVDYTPIRDVTTIKLNEISNFNDLPLTTAFDETGAGEHFSGTSDRNTITLNNAPYIERSEAFDDDDYSPVSVIMEDGNPAINVTDYTNAAASEFPAADDESYYYIHSGRKLLFNKAAGPMRVFYQYLENNVRFRAILRCNTQDFVSPEIDYVQVKAKIRKPDQSL